MPSWSKYCLDTLALWIKTPEPYAHKFERVKRLDGVITSIWRQDDDGLMGKITITGCLTQGFLPVRKFHFKRTTGRLCNFGKRNDRGEGLCRNSSPSDCQQVCDSITVNGNLLHECDVSFSRTFVDLCRLRKIGASKSTRETFFRRCFMGVRCRKIIFGLVEAESGNGCDASIHNGLLRFLY